MKKIIGFISFLCVIFLLMSINADAEYSFGVGYTVVKNDYYPHVPAMFGSVVMGDDGNAYYSTTKYYEYDTHVNRLNYSTGVMDSRDLDVAKMTFGTAINIDDNIQYVATFPYGMIDFPTIIIYDWDTDTFTQVSYSGMSPPPPVGYYIWTDIYYIDSISKLFVCQNFYDMNNDGGIDFAPPTNNIAVLEFTVEDNGTFTLSGLTNVTGANGKAGLIDMVYCEEFNCFYLLDISGFLSGTRTQPCGIWNYSIDSATLTALKTDYSTYFSGIAYSKTTHCIYTKSVDATNEIPPNSPASVNTILDYTNGVMNQYRFQDITQDRNGNIWVSSFAAMSYPPEKNFIEYLDFNNYSWVQYETGEKNVGYLSPICAAPNKDFVAFVEIENYTLGILYFTNVNENGNGGINPDVPADRETNYPTQRKIFGDMTEKQMVDYTLYLILFASILLIIFVVFFKKQKRKKNKR